MRVRTLFVCCAAALATLAGAAAVTTVVQEWHSYGSANEAGHLSTAAGGLLRASEKLALSRGVQSAPLISDTQADEKTRGTVAAVRQALTEALTATEGAIASADYPERASALAAIRGVTDELNGLYARLDQAYMVAKPQRDPALLKDFVPSMLAISNRLNGLANGLERSAASADATIGHLIGIARLSWDMRDAGGRRSTVFTAAIGNGRKLTMGDIENESALTGEIRHAWSRLQATVSQIDGTPGLTAALRETEAKFFGDPDTFIAALAAKGLAGSDYGVSFQETWNRLIGAAQTALGVRDAAIQEASSRAETVRDAAITRLSIAAVALALGIAMVTGVVILFTRRVVDPLVEMTTAMIRLADGDRETNVPACGRHDEIGEMAGALETLRQNAITAARIDAEQRAHEASRAARAEAIEAMTRDFDVASAAVIQALDVASTTVRRDAQASSDLATGTSAQAASVAAGAEQASVSAGSIAAAATAMSEAIAGIVQRVEACTAITADAVAAAVGADQRITGMDQAVERIGSILKIIENIAAQTNLLALNATIEAARAGDAGKGFAVVAGEVKALATQTAKAIQDITAQIAAIEAETRAAVQAIKGVSQAIGRVDEVTASIADAVTQQRETTNEIAANAHQAAAGTKDVSASLGEVNAAMSQTEAGAHRMIATADDLADRSRDLTGRIAAFLTGVRAA